MESSVRISSHDGQEFSALIVKPPQNSPAPAVVVIQEIFGVNANMRRACRWLAEAGFIAICPDLFWRLEPGLELNDRIDAERTKAFGLFEKFNVDLGIEDLKSTLASARTMSGCTGKIGTIGYCLGGKLAFLMATRSTSEANVSYYGVGLDSLLGEASRIHAPLLMHIAEKDEFVPPASQAKIIDTLKNNPWVTITTHLGVDHAFTRVGGAHYEPQAAAKADAQTLAMLAKTLGVGSTA